MVNYIENTVANLVCRWIDLKRLQIWPHLSLKCPSKSSIASSISFRGDIMLLFIRQCSETHWSITEARPPLSYQTAKQINVFVKITHCKKSTSKALAFGLLCADRVLKLSITYPSYNKRNAVPQCFMHSNRIFWSTRYENPTNWRLV